MKPCFRALLLATLVPAVTHAATFTKVMYLPAEGANKRLVVELRDDTILHDDNACASVADCAKKYRLERALAGDHEIIDIESATVLHQSKVEGDGLPIFETLTFALSSAPKKGTELSLTAFDLIAFLPKEVDPLKQRKALGKTLFVAPQIALQPVSEDDALKFEGVRAPLTIEYQSLTPLHYADTDEERSQASSKISATDADPVKFKQPYALSVHGIETKSKAGILHELRVSGIPRGAKVDVVLNGLESYAGQPLQAKGTVQAVVLPKGRDDSEFYVNVGVDADDLADSRKYKLDLRVQEKFRTGRLWVVGSTLDVMVGNKTSKAPNTGSVSLDFQRWFLRDLSKYHIHSAAITYAPVFRTDREFVNKQAGLDIVFEPLFTGLEQQLFTRRTREQDRGGPPLTRKWGWRVRPSLAFEYGKNLGSTLPEVDDETYTRLRGGLSITIERLQWQLTVAAVARYLFEDEILMQVVDNQPTAVRVDRNQRRHARIELAYNLGNVALSVTHADGRLPPAYTPVNTTGFGITFKF
jgi:hypothetical protein